MKKKMGSAARVTSIKEKCLGRLCETVGYWIYSWYFNEQEPLISLGSG